MDLFVVKIISTSCKTILFFYFGNFIQCRKRISKRVSHIFCPTYSSTTVFLAKSFFNHWNVSLGLEKNFILYTYVVTSWWFNGFCFVWKLKWMFPKKQKFVAKDDFKRDHICCKDSFEATWWKNCFDFLLNTFKKLTPIFN